MKIQKIVNYACVIMLMVTTTISCKEEIANKAVLKTALSANELSATTASTYVLTFPTRDATFDTFRWTATDFGFSGSVTYKLQIDKSTGNWTTPLELASVSSLTQVTLSNSIVNDRLLGLGLSTDNPSSVKIRVVSTVSDKVAAVVSNERTFTVTPYPVVFPPYYGRGDGLNGWGNWGDGIEVEFASFDFNVYWTYAYLTNGKIFRLFKLKDWNGPQFNFSNFTNVDSDLALNTPDNDKNFKVLCQTGWYKVVFNMNTSTVTVDPATEPTMYMVGGALPLGWNWPNIKMKFISPGLFEATTPITQDIFRFFPNNGDWGTSYGYTYFSSVANVFILNTPDNDKNLRYIAAPGTITIRVDMNQKKVIKL